MRTACASTSRASARSPPCSRAARTRRRPFARSPRRRTASTSSATGMRAWYKELLAVPGARRARVALLLADQSRASLAAYQQRLDGLGIRFDALTLRDVAGGAPAGYGAVVAPPARGGVPEIAGVEVVTTLRASRPGSARDPRSLGLVGVAASPACSRASGARRASPRSRSSPAARWRSSAGSESPTRCARTPRRRSSRSSWLSPSASPPRGVAALAAGAAVRRLRGPSVPVPRAHRQPGREPARPALRHDQRGLDRARARRAARRRACRLPRRASCCRSSSCWRRRRCRWPGARAPPTRQGTGVLRPALACCWPRSSRIRRRGRASADLLHVQVVLALAFAAVGATSCWPRHLVEPQPDGLERVQLLLPRELDLRRPSSRPHLAVTIALVFAGCSSARCAGRWCGVAAGLGDGILLSYSQSSMAPLSARVATGLILAFAGAAASTSPDRACRARARAARDTEHPPLPPPGAASARAGSPAPACISSATARSRASAWADRPPPRRAPQPRRIVRRHGTPPSDGDLRARIVGRALVIGCRGLARLASSARRSGRSRSRSASPFWRFACTLLLARLRGTPDVGARRPPHRRGLH